MEPNRRRVSLTGVDKENPSDESGSGKETRPSHASPERASLDHETLQRCRSHLPPADDATRVPDWRGQVQSDLRSMAADQRRILGELRLMAEGQQMIVEALGCKSVARMAPFANSLAPSIGLDTLYKDMTPTEMTGAEEATFSARKSRHSREYARAEGLESFHSLSDRDALTPTVVTRDPRTPRNYPGGVGGSSFLQMSVTGPTAGTAGQTPRNRNSLVSASGDVTSLHVPMNWPKEIPLRETLRPRQMQRAPLSLFAHGDEELTCLARESTTRYLNFKVAMAPHEGPASHFLTAKTCVMTPGSKLRMALDLTSLAVLLFELTLMPVALAWDWPWNTFMSTSTWVVCCWWTTDIFMSFRTAFYRNGVLITSSMEIRTRYLRGYFPLDAVLLAGDWGTIVFNTLYDQDSAQSVASMSKALKVTRVVKVARMVRIAEVIMRIADRCRLNRNWKIVLEVLAPLLTILWLNHCTTCMWYTLGRSDLSDTDRTWLDLENHDGITYRELKPVYQYTTAFHWSMTQMTPGSMQVNPLSSVERVFTICCLISGLIVFGTLVSSLSAKLMQWRMSKQEVNTKLVMLRRFLLQAKVNSTLCIKVEKQVTESLVWRRPLTYQDVPVLQVLSLSLRKELRSELGWKSLVSHALFKMCAQVDVLAVQTICTEAVEMRVLSPSENLFLPNTHAAGAFYLKAGKLQYKQEPLTSRVEEPIEIDVTEGAWISEAALWAEWTHVGTIEALEMSQLYDVVADLALTILLRTRMLDSLVLEYARVFHGRLVQGFPPWPNDLRVSGTDFEDIMLATSDRVRVFVGLIALEALRVRAETKRDKLPNMAIDELEDEIHEKQSLLLMDDKGDVHRITTATVLNLKDAEERSFTQLGKWCMDDGFKVQCRLPGIKQEIYETADQSLNRLLEGKLKCIARAAYIHGGVRRAQTTKSHHYDLPTKYILMEYGATLNAPDYLECVPSLCIRKAALPLYPNDVAHRTPQRQSGRTSKRAPPGNSTRSPPHGFTDIVLVPVDDWVYFFAWLAPGDCEFYGSKDGDRILNNILEDLEGEAKKLQQGQGQDQVTMLASLESGHSGFGVSSGSDITATVEREAPPLPPPVDVEAHNIPAGEYLEC